MSVLRVCPLLPSLDEALRGHYKIVDEPSDEVVAAVTTSKYGVSNEQMDALPNLRAIVHFGVGYETTDVDHARARGIVVSNTPDVLTDSVADLAVGGLIDVLRRMSAADRFVRRGDWAHGQFPLAVKVTGRRVGILGLGRIGRAIAHRLTAFDCVLSYHSRHQIPDVPYTYADSPAALAAGVDVLVVATSGGSATAGLVSAAVLAALGPSGYLVNIARGSVVDEPALVEALRAGTIAGAALDVFADEPNVPPALLDRDDVVLLPHIGSADTETREAMGDLAFRNLQQFMTDGTLVTPVA
ncbi:2-hydroxyacid dehydrogenase [Actinophytocola sp.]|uniref:2-hydroxyacid dehydrogenase n=1 Tax=Actinophytocola sp. TaxID=1872138 RepID=UPI00389B15FD